MIASAVLSSAMGFLPGAEAMDTCPMPSLSRLRSLRMENALLPGLTLRCYSVSAEARI